MRSAITILAISWLLGELSRAAPAPPIESLLQRAETVMIVDVAAITETSVNFRRLEVLRGDSGEPKFTLAIEQGTPCLVECIGRQYLLLSQGDGRFGPPRPIVGRTMFGQFYWRGWIPLPITYVDDGKCVETIWSKTDLKMRGLKDAAKPMTLERVKQLIEQFPYNPHVNDEGR